MSLMNSVRLTDLYIIVAYQIFFFSLIYFSAQRYDSRR